MVAEEIIECEDVRDPMAQAKLAAAVQRMLAKKRTP
jgi:hypothetical protein